MSTPSFIVGVPLLAVLAVATFSDLRTRRIPNALSLGGAALGVLINAATFGQTGALLAVVGWVLCLVCFLPLYVSGGTAAGDVKLMAMVGAFLGPINGFIACLCALAIGASIASLHLALHHFVAPRLVPQGAARAGGQTLGKIPYASAIALGGAAAVMQPEWVMAFFKLGATS